jgi:hypothetical protein
MHRALHSRAKDDIKGDEQDFSRVYMLEKCKSMLSLESEGQHACSTKELPLKELGNALDEADELAECWDKRFTVNNLALSERYREGSLDIAWLFEGEPFAAGLKYHCAIFKRILAVCGNEIDHGEDNFFLLPRHLHPRTETQGSMCYAHRNNQGMFVENVHLVESPEVGYPSFVRLKSFDESDCGGVCPTNFLRSEGFLAGTYWEIGIVDCSSACVAVKYDQSDRQMVKSASKVMNYIPYGAAPLGRHRRVDADTVEFVSGIRVCFDENGVGPFRKKGGNFPFQPIALLLGLIDL